MIKVGAKVKLVGCVWDGEVPGKVVGIDDNNVALVQIMNLGSWHYLCPTNELIKLTDQEGYEFYGTGANVALSWVKK